MTLELGQVVRYSGALWRVDFINDCRARIVPLTKQHVVIMDDEGNPVRGFDRVGRGVNISPNSVLDIVRDPEQAAVELELEQAEQELARLRAEAAKQTAPWVHEPTVVERQATAELARAVGDWKPIATGAGPAPPAGWRWHPLQPMTVWVENVTAGSLKFDVLTLVDTRPGMTTKEIARALEDVATAGAVAACLDRFYKSGVLRRDSK